MNSLNHYDERKMTFPNYLTQLDLPKLRTDKINKVMYYRDILSRAYEAIDYLHYYLSLDYLILLVFLLSMILVRLELKQQIL
jgi:hypothetical protein